MSNLREENNKTGYPLSGGIPAGFDVAPSTGEMAQKCQALMLELDSTKRNLYDCQRDISQRDTRIEMLQQEIEYLKHIIELMLIQPSRTTGITPPSPSFPPYQGPTCG